MNSEPAQEEKGNGSSIITRNGMAITGIIIALLGIVLCYASMEVKESKPSVKKSSVEKTEEKKFTFSFSWGKERSEEKRLREEQKQELLKKQKSLRISGGILGGIAILLGIGAFLRKEYSRAVATTISLGAVAVFWEIFLIVLVVGLIGIILINS